MAPELAPANAEGTISISRRAARNPACAKKPKNPEEKATPTRPKAFWDGGNFWSNAAISPRLEEEPFPIGHH